MDYETETHEVDIWQGVCVITCKSSGEVRQVILKTRGKLSTEREFKSCIKTHGLQRAINTFWKIAKG